jgi:dihydropyrimidinase
VHLAAADALAYCRSARAAGAEVYVETRPMYLNLTADRYGEHHGARFAGYPPLRTDKDVDALWAGLRHGDVDVVATDHAPWGLAAKLDPALDATTLRPGVAELETSLPTLWSNGVRTGRISIERFVEVTSTNPARLFGLFPRKGSVTVGADADLVVWDPTATWTVDASTMHTRADYSPYDGMEITGSPELTISRGEIVATNRRAHGRPGRGRPLRRGRAAGSGRPGPP